MDLLTIGAFARMSQLSPKALRLYDELGVLAPAAVEPESGYRLYRPEQVEHAQLIVQLRRIGMPLDEIRTVCSLDPTAAAGAIATFWQRVAADTSTRAQLATSLVKQLSRKDQLMSDPNSTLDVRYSTGCETGAVRNSNQDAVYASQRLLAVADGGGGPGGAAASAAAIDALRLVELADVPAAELLTMLADAVADADRAVRGAAHDGQDALTTLTAMLCRGSQLALVHIGDTRVYLLRGGELIRLTQDHTWVQTQVDAGKLNRDEAAAHQQRAVLVRALGIGTAVEADLALRTALAGDRYLLCSDGLSVVVDHPVLEEALSTAGDPEQTVQQLLTLAQNGGAPDNIACVVADFHAA
jgi:serine/threonine protein phosphatase PrpC